MAADISKEDIECCVCEERYDDGEHLPKRLNCSHSLCRSCARELISMNQSFKCPLCCKENLPVQSVDDLATDLSTIRLVQVMNSAMTCQCCEEIHDLQTCATCARKLCEECAWICYYIHLQEYETAKEETVAHESAAASHVQSQPADFNAEESEPVILRNPRRCSLAVGLLGQFVDTEANIEASADKDKKKKKPRKRKQKLRKEDIAAPTNFRHIYHIGYDPNKGYDMTKVDPDMKMLLDAVGVTQSQLHDLDTSNFIYDFIEQNGGVEAVKEEAARLRQSQAPKKPDRGVIMTDDM